MKTNTATTLGDMIALTLTEMATADRIRVGAIRKAAREEIVLTKK